MFKQLRKANQNDYLLITATLILLVVFNLSLLSYVQGQQKAAERDQAKDYEEALKFADVALYEVKIAGKNNFASYKSSLTEKKHHNQLGLGLRALAAGDPTPLLVMQVMQMDTKEAIYVNTCWSCLAANCRQNSTTITASHRST
ncbi:diguanylate cyclase [Lactobacillus delbrueckii]|uniref:diguanylate cyclase n=1 Tax=Lactobacillus delbrueckii TaxID=1584 RepID=UPI003A86504E